MWAGQTAITLCEISSALKFVIIGAGAVGGYLGGRLSQSGEDVTFLVRSRRREELLKDGLRIKSPLGDASVRVRTVSEADAIDGFDVLIVAVKNYALDSVLKDIAQLGKKGSWVISVLNGIEHIDKISSVVRMQQIVGGPLYIEATLGAGGEVLHKSVTPSLTLGSLAGDTEPATAVAAAFEKAGIKSTVSEDLLRDLWRKSLFITVFSAMTSIARKPIGPILADQWTNGALEALVSEVVLVAHSAEPRVRTLGEEELLKRIRGMPPTMTSSMYHDNERGAPTEVESMQGYLVRKADRFKLDVPVLKTCYGFLRLLGKEPAEYVSTFRSE
jgi:2-dehydropantoate 2-reductase